MTIKSNEELFDENGCIAVWGKVSTTGKPYYIFDLTAEDRYILFPCYINNPKAPKFQLRKTDKKKVNAEE